jgi:hypothetical protein
MTALNGIWQVRMWFDWYQPESDGVKEAQQGRNPVGWYLLAAQGFEYFEIGIVELY